MTLPPSVSMSVPYARRVEEEGRWFAVCPECDERIELRAMKDFESPSAIEYARHYRWYHGDCPHDVRVVIDTLPQTVTCSDCGGSTR